MKSTKKKKKILENFCKMLIGLFKKIKVYSLIFNLLHITPEGKPAYQARFLDTAPFRNGLAWVQAKDGRWTQIDKRGIPVTRWYDNSEIS
jgi:ADP-dependent phosphofructokinase/glucokinase